MTKAPTLAESLASPLGRGTFIEQDAQCQLTGSAGTLTTQLCELLDASLSELRSLLEVRADLPPRRPHPWTVLTEFEHATWPILALSRPPALSVTATTRIVRHLATAHLAMDMGRSRQWAQAPALREGTEPLLDVLTEGQADKTATWAALITAITTIQTQHVMLHGWGVLSAYVGLNLDLRIRAAQALLAALERQPELCQDPVSFAAEALWAALTLLHGGLPRPSTPEIKQLARAMRTLPERTFVGILPEPVDLTRQLAELLPTLAKGPRHELADRLSGLLPTDPNLMTTGITALSQPGQTAIWLRRAGEVQLITCCTRTATDPLEVRAWRWRLPKRGSSTWAI